MSMSVCLSVCVLRRLVTCSRQDGPFELKFYQRAYLCTRYASTKKQFRKRLILRSVLVFVPRAILRPVLGAMVFLAPCIYEGIPAAKMQEVDEYLSVRAKCHTNG